MCEWQRQQNNGKSFTKRGRQREAVGAALWSRGGKLVLKVQQSRVQLFYVHANFALSSRGNTESCKRKSACGSKSVRLWAETERERAGDAE